MHPDGCLAPPNEIEMQLVEPLALRVIRLHGESACNWPLADGYDLTRRAFLALSVIRLGGQFCFNFGCQKSVIFADKNEDTSESVSSFDF